MESDVGWTEADARRLDRVADTLLANVDEQVDDFYAQVLEHPEPASLIYLRPVSDWAAQINAGIIVMPSHGRTGLSRMLIGSVAERMVRLAHCAVMVRKRAE